MRRKAKHRLVMERHIGRLLTCQEVVHHINCDSTDNRIENLRLFNNSTEHKKEHKRLRRLNPDKNIIISQKEYDKIKQQLILWGILLDDALNINLDNIKPFKNLAEYLLIKRREEAQYNYLRDRYIQGISKV